MKKIIIGLTGPEGVGKSTFSKNLSRLLGEENCTRLAFADDLYLTASFMLNIPVEKLKSQDYKNVVWNESTAPIPSLIGWWPRKFIQKLATECVRNIISDSFWIEKTLVKCTKEYNIIEDARFENEMSRCDIIIKLEREGIKYQGNHSSSQEPDKKLIWDTIDLNNFNEERQKLLISDINGAKSFL